MDRAIFARPDFLSRSEELVEIGGPELAFHLRAPAAAGGVLFAALERLAAAASSSGSLVLVNDRVDVALAGAAHGVQLGRGSLPPAIARGLLGPRRLIGASVHDREEAVIAARGGVDFLLCGALYATPSHPGRPGSGLEWLRAAAEAGAPVIGIGGITPERVPEVLAAGAHGVAVIRAIWDQPAPARALERFLTVLAE